MVRDAVREGAKDDPLLFEFGFVGRRDGDAVEHGIDCHPRLYACDAFLLQQRDPKLFIGLAQLGIDFVEAVEFGHLFGGGVVDDVLVVDLRVVNHRPLGLRKFGLHLVEAFECLQAKVEQPFGFVFLGRDHAHDILVQTRRELVGVDVRRKTVFVVALGKISQLGIIEGVVEGVARGVTCIERLVRFFTHGRLSSLVCS